VRSQAWAAREGPRPLAQEPRPSGAMIRGGRPAVPTDVFGARSRRSIPREAHQPSGPIDLLLLTTVSACLPSYELGTRTMRPPAARIDRYGCPATPCRITVETSVHLGDASAGYVRAVGSESTDKVRQRARVVRRID
jgi:hypothetical protein